MTSAAPSTDDQPRRRKVALIMAMSAEAAPIREHFNLQKREPFDARLPFELYHGNVGERIELLLSIAGKDTRYGVDCVGTDSATLNTYVSLQHFAPDLVLNAGTAGAFLQHESAVGDVYLAMDGVKYHDRRIPIPGFDVYGVGSFPAKQLPEAWAAALGLKCGTVSTGNSLDCTDTDLKMLHSNVAHVKEMEAAAIAWVAHLLGVPFVALKSVTDLIDGEHAPQDEFLRNLTLASERLREKLVLLLSHLDTHTDQW